MRKTIKAVLLSAFVLPGAGHFSLDKPVKGAFLLVLTMVCLYFIFSPIFEISQDVSGKIINGELPYDVGKITQVVSGQLAGSENRILKISSWALFFCWIFAIVDSYRIGRLQDKNDSRKIN